MSLEHVVILKNDATGDLPPSLSAIYKIIEDNKVKKVTIFLSELSKKFSFLFKNRKVNTKVLNYNLSIKEKINIFFFILTNKIDKVYIIAPKNFYYFLPIFFWNIKFYAVCINNINNYKRPGVFFRRFLFKYVINNRSAIFKRSSAQKIQNELINSNNNFVKIKLNIEISKEIKSHLPEDYFYFHMRKKRILELGWGNEQLMYLFDEFLKHCNKLIITKDVAFGSKYEDAIDDAAFLKSNYSYYNLKNAQFIKNHERIIFFDNIDGVNIYHLIRNAKKTIAFHGMMTALGSVENKPVLDLFHCNIKNWNDYRKYRNSFYEFKPKYNGYDFIIPKNDIKKTVKKMQFSLKK